jgi:hypothetical protein
MDVLFTEVWIYTKIRNFESQKIRISKVKNGYYLWSQRRLCEKGYYAIKNMKNG